jgi:predicted AAA+ superfamily ATPase
VDSYSAYQFIATGSAAAVLKLKSKESGAGRFTDFLLPPLTFSEYLAFIKKEDTLITTDGEIFSVIDIEALNAEFINYLNYGGYPEAVLSITAQKDSARYIKSDIIDKVLLRDLPSIYGIADVQELNALFTTIAYNTGNEINLESLSQSSGVSKSTIKKYLTYLEAAFLIKTVHRVDINAKTFKRATRFKVYLTNPSMRAALFGTIEEGDEAMGSLVETAIFSQWLHIDNRLHYARWSDGEVDI